jgi:hypothetical protein
MSPNASRQSEHIRESDNANDDARDEEGGGVCEKGEFNPTKRCKDF